MFSDIRKGLKHNRAMQNMFTIVKMLLMSKVPMSNLRKHLQVCSLISVEYNCKVNAAWFKQLKRLLEVKKKSSKSNQM